MVAIKSGFISSFVMFLAFFITVMLTYYFVSKGKKITIRRLPAIDALDEAIGRATEMGRPIHVTPGDSGLTGSAASQTVAGLEVSSAVARKCAEVQVPMYITTPNAVVHALQTDIAVQSYRLAGQEFDISNSILYPYWTSFAIGISGLVYRENVAANISIGGWHGICLILFETASRIGAFQIGGTAATSQLPWFVACCDYYVLGEEVFAAGAYLSQSVADISAIWSQDLFKLIVTALIAVGIVISLLTNSTGFSSLFSL